MRKSIVTTVAAAALFIPLTSTAQSAGEQVRPSFSHVIPNIPGKSLVAVEVTYPPGGASPPHHHSASAFIYARVLSGRIESKVDGEPARVYGPGESFYETPGAHHLVSRNASATVPATLLAVFVVDTNETSLTVPDAKK